ncbi:hypothetical protein ABZ468_33880 [Streptomyces sp. NPDC005708]
MAADEDVGEQRARLSNWTLSPMPPMRTSNLVPEGRCSTTRRSSSRTAGA